MDATNQPLLDVRDLSVAFGRSVAVDGISFSIKRGECVALVGESGSGKSVSALSVLKLLPYPTASHPSGAIRFRGRDLLTASDQEMREVRGNDISIIFQEPMTSLSPLHTVGDQVGEAVMLHRDVGTAEARELTRDMLRLVGFPDPARALDTYPFELSGGLRQRAMIAMALICRPSLLIADEPTTALDVTIQAQILKLIRDLQGELGMAVLMITHDLGVVANVAEEVVVMYRGEVMESGEMRDIFAKPRHPYLKALLRAVPRFHMEPGERLVPIREIKSAGGKLLEATRDPWPAGADSP